MEGIEYSYCSLRGGSNCTMFGRDCKVPLCKAGKEANAALEAEAKAADGAEAPTSAKNDRQDHKLRWELLPLDLVEQVVAVYTFGAEKYAENSWQNLPDGYRRYKAALLRHLTAYDKGEVLDPESNLPHLAHAAWNALALLHFTKE